MLMKRSHNDREKWLEVSKITIGLEEDFVLFVHFGDVSIPSYWDVQQSFKTCKSFSHKNALCKVPGICFSGMILPQWRPPKSAGSAGWW